ncbi:MAG: hypothetical protein UR82_C0091G0003 [Candidatus Moranbacteria bacterium GW2011_GWF1_35_5]|nr:MAG: hypothetical protein UR82_C0091G0003 [Candidatus Moranbacteria bacterium GW2011_GWF1_35_5]
MKLKLKLKIIFLVVSTLAVFIIAEKTRADWQSTMESHFDIVDSFDEYNDWVGSYNNGGCNNLGSCDLPVLTGGGAGLWDTYDDYSMSGGCTGPEPGEYWIADHGSGLKWSGNKSLRMSYTDPLITPNNHYDIRLDFNSGGTYQPQNGDSIIGQTSLAASTITGIVRYPDQGNWATGNALGEFYITSVNKTGTFIEGENVTINGNSNAAKLYSGELSGFSDCNDRLGPSRVGMYFGNGSPESGYDEMHLFFMAKFPSGSIKYLPQVSRYGYIGTWKFYEIEQGFANIYWWEDGEDRARTCQNTNYANGFCGLDNCWTYGGYNDETDSVEFGSSNFLSEYEEGNWVGMEVRWKIGTLNGMDAEYEEWYYDESGNVISHNLKTGLRAKTEFNNRINKFVLGGNRFAQTYGLQEGDVGNGSFYVDDLIIDDQRVGPTYFSLLAGNSIIRSDVDNSSVTNTTDALLTLRNSLGLSMDGTAWQVSATTGDVDCNETSNSTDALLILRYSLGLSMDGTSWCE